MPKYSNGPMSAHHQLTADKTLTMQVEESPPDTSFSANAIMDELIAKKNSLQNHLFGIIFI